MKNRFLDSEIGEMKTVEIAQTSNQIYSSQTNNLTGQVPTVLPVALSIFGVLILIWFINTFIQICKPNEILILSIWRLARPHSSITLRINLPLMSVLE